MQIPRRRSQILQIREDEGPAYVTASALQSMQVQLETLIRERPQIVEELSFARQKGDLSENAEYQDARTKLSRIDGRIFSMREKIKRASIIPVGPSEDGRVRIGSAVLLRTEGVVKTYRIVGSQEASPSQGRVSHASPLGRALLDRHKGETISIETPSGTKTYLIEDVR